MRLCTTILLIITLFSVGFTQLNARSSEAANPITVYAGDSLLNKITNIDKRLKQFIVKDTISGYSTPRLIDTSEYINIPSLPSRKDDVPRDKKGLIIIPREYEPFYSFTSFRDTIIFDPVMLPVVFDGKILPQKLDFRSHRTESPKITSLIDKDSIVAPNLLQARENAKNHYKLIDEEETYAPQLARYNRINKIRKEYYTAHPILIKSNALTYDGRTPITQLQVESKNPFKELVTAGDAVSITRPDVEKFEIKQVYWKFGAIHELKFSQKAYSDNWTPSTDDNFQLQNYHKFTAQFRKGKVQFDHLIEWRFNAQYTKLAKLEDGQEDIRQRFLINDDWVRTYNKLGLNAFIKRWSYILTLDVKTPIFTKKPQNDKNKKLAALFSPLDVNFGLGAGYTLESKSKTSKDRVFKLSIDATPFSLDLKYVGNDDVWNDNKYGVVYEDDPERRRYSKIEFGSTLNSTISYSFNRYTNINTRLKYFTNYERAYLECENTVNFQLNRYLATSLYIYMKFDDSVGREKRSANGWGYFSFNEVLGFGLSYTW